MSILDNSFEGNKGGAFVATKEVMPEDKFWAIIESCYRQADGDYDLQQQVLYKELLQLSATEIMQFDNRFLVLRGEAYTWDLWGAAYIVDGGCSDDSFMDFRSWLIAQGRDFYYTMRSNPDSLAAVDAERIAVDWEGIAYVATAAFEAVAGEEMPSVHLENHEVLGEEWDEDGDDLKNRLPLLWAKYS